MYTLVSLSLFTTETTICRLKAGTECDVTLHCISYGVGDRNSLQDSLYGLKSHLTSGKLIAKLIGETGGQGGGVKKEAFPSPVPR